jgi:hypothetical protein
VRKDEETQWMDKAEEALASAKTIKDLGAKATMFGIAKGHSPTPGQSVYM